jgi:glycosyltransferase involved in cell wall biosynthesis
MRVLHVVPTYLPATRYGGPIFAVHGLCRALVRRGLQVDVFTTNIDGDGVSDVPIGVAVDVDGVRVHYFASPMRRLYYSPAMRKALHVRVSDFDLVHTHSVFLWPTASAARAARQARVPYLISPRGMLVPELIQRKSRFTKKAWISLVEQRNFRHASAIHFTSEQELEDCGRLGVRVPRAAVVPNGIDIPTLRHLPRDPSLVLYLGRITWKKGLDRLIEAVARLKSARLVIAGRDDEGYTASLPRHERVTFVGEVGGATKERLLATAAMLVLPSVSENFGNVVLEAMAYGTPVIVTPGVGLASDVEKARAGIVTDGAPAALAEAIERLLADVDLRDAMGGRARALVESRFGWDVVAGEMEALYRSCSSASRRSS